VKSGRRLGIDYGDVRIGLALSDPSGIIATPLSTITLTGPSEGLGEIAAIVQEYDIAVIYVGLPLHLSGGHGESSMKVRGFVGELSARIGPSIPIRLVDERLSTSSAQRQARDDGRKVSKENIDQLAATIILENALHAEKLQGELAGKSVDEL